jgi:putative CocE/NonD family hydrolase
MPRRSTVVFSAVVLLLISLVSPASAVPDEYTVTLQQAVPVTMADGTVLRADIQSPTGAPGPFPVLLAQTPYGRAVLNDEMSYFVKQGYIAVSVDVRGTGSSEGAWVPFGPQETADGVELVHWAAALPGSNGKLGLYGDSYKGINQLTTAAAVGPNSPVKAVFPVVAGNDLYRDVFAMGGMPNAEFLPLWLLLTGTESLTNPLTEALASGDPQRVLDAARVALQHVGGVAANILPLLTASLTGGAEAFDGDYWQARNPANILDKVVANGIPAYLVGGWDDLFQRGALMNYAGLQNAWAGRPTSAPMTPGQPVTGRYQLLMGPWSHYAQPGFDVAALKLRWYDHWLKDVDNGVADTATPLHAYQVNGGQWFDTTTYPFTGATPTTLYFGEGNTGTAARSANDGPLTPSPPTAAGTDWITWTPVNSTCTRSTFQWLGGANLLSAPGCETSDLERETGPNSLVYTGNPVSQPTVIAGPISATIYAQSNTLDTQWVVTVTDVAPDGTSQPLSEGALIGSQRAIDPGKSWYGADGSLLMPYHPYTVASEKWVEPNTVTRYDVEVFPVFAKLAAGHRIRVVVTTADTPHLAPTLTQLPRLLLGIYQLKTGPSAPSSVTIPLAPESAFTPG